MRKPPKSPTGSFIWGFHEETRSERKLAGALKKAGIKFGQEVPVKEFTVDFLIDDWLVVEVDGESHLTSQRKKSDEYRQKKIEDSGFTVMRIHASLLGTPGGLKSAVERIRKAVIEGPPYMRARSGPNEDLVRQVREIEKALRIGEAEKKKRQALAFGPDKGSKDYPGEKSPRPDTGESMEDYFGKKGEDFEALLEGYDWSKVPTEKEPDSGSLKRRPGGKRKRRS